jgi:hypothetical protein
MVSDASQLLVMSCNLATRTSVYLPRPDDDDDVLLLPINQRT